MKLAPETRASELIDRLNDFLHQGVYADPGSFQMRAIKRDCEAVRDVEPAIGWALLGLYSALCGDIDKTEQCFNASFRLKYNDSVASNYYVSLGNLGFFTKAHEWLLEIGQPESGNLSSLIPYADHMGSFQTLLALSKHADSIGIILQNPLSESCVQAANILARFGVSDMDVLCHLDAAGHILRKNCIFNPGDIEVDISDIEGIFVGVTCILRIKKTPMEVFELNVELAEAEHTLNVKKHAVFDVMFKPV
jgi:hypothetical protein